MRGVLSIFFLFLNTLLLFSQSPGGVTSGGNLRVWFSADSDVTGTPGTGTLTWGDRSGNDNHAVQATPASHPTSVELINYNQIFSFDGVDDRFPITNFSYADNQELSNLNVFVVYKSDATSSGDDNKAFVGFDGGSGFAAFLRGNNGRLNFRSRGSSVKTEQVNATSITNDDVPHIGSYIFNSADASGLDTRVNVDGTEELSKDVHPANIKFNQTRSGFIGDDSSSGNLEDATAAYQGDIAEIIMYDASVLSVSEIQKIESYLALKYGVSLSGNYYNSAGVTPIWDATANSIYHHNVGGIINDSSVGAIHQKISHPINSDITISTIDNYVLANNDGSRTDVVADTYLLFGDNDASDGFKAIDIAGKIRLKKEWFFVESAVESNNVFLQISEDLFPSGASVSILVSSDTDFSDDTPVAMSYDVINGVYKTTTAIDLDDNDRVTFLIDDSKVAGVSTVKFNFYINAENASTSGGVLTLNDLSNSNAHAVQDVASKTPTVTQTMNFNPTLTFDGTDDYLYIKNKFYDVGDVLPILHTYAVFNTNFSSGPTDGEFTNGALLDFDRSGVFSNYVRGDNGFLRLRYREGGSGRSETAVSIANDSVPHIAEYLINGNLVGDDTFLKLDGVVDDVDDKFTGNIVVDRKRFGFVGVHGNASSENSSLRGTYFNGKISEIIMTDSEVLDSDETLQIQSYLALKYGITLDESLGTYKNSAGTIIWDNIDYWNGVAGLITDNVDSKLEQSVAHSTLYKDIIVATTSDFTSDNIGRPALNNGSYLLFGSNGDVEGATLENPTLSKNFTSRLWLFKEGGTNLDDVVHIAIPKTYFFEGTTGVQAYINKTGVYTMSDTPITLTDDGTYFHFSRDMDDGDILAFAVDVPVINGPGNVSDGLKMWIRPEDVIATTGGQVNSALDASFSGSNLIESTYESGIDRRPIINLNETNYNPAITFDRDRLAIKNLNYDGIGVINKLYAWIVYKTDFFASNTNPGIDDKNSALISFDRRRYFKMDVRGDGKLEMTYEDSDNDRSTAIGATVTNNGTTQLGGFIFDNSKVDETVLRLNGAVDFEDDMTTLNIGTDASPEARFGYVGDGSDAVTFDSEARERYYDGAISEIAFYQGETLNDDQIARVESYLAIKYGVALSGNYVDSDYDSGVDPAAHVVWNATTNADYTNDVAIIGRDDKSTLNQKQSKSESADGILTIALGAVEESNEDNMSSFSSDQQFLAWGNNGTDEDFAIDCDAAGRLKVNKNWKVQNTGSVGVVTLQFDMSNIPDPGNFDLVFDTDGDYSTTGDQIISPITGSLSGTNLTFTGVALSTGAIFSLVKNSDLDITYNGSAWTGGSGTDGVPTEADLAKRITIEDDVTITESFECTCLKVNATKVLTAPTETYILANEVTFDGDIYLEGTAELIQPMDNTVNSGSGSIHKVLDEATSSPYQYNFLSSPVVNASTGTFTLKDDLKINTGLTLADNTPTTFTRDNDGFGTTLSTRWTHTLNDGLSFVEINENVALEAGVGFTMKGTGTANKYNFVGKPNNGKLNLTVSNDNYLLTGNPYPSSINIDDFNTLNEITNNVTDGVVYLWEDPVSTAHSPGTTDAQGGYATRANGVGTAAVTESDIAIPGAVIPGAFIKPGQGFIVFGERNGEIEFNNTLRDVTYDTTRKFFKAKKIQSHRPVIRLGFDYVKENGNHFHRQIATVLESGSTLEKEKGKDAPMFDYFSNDIFWTVEGEEDRFVITSVSNEAEDLEVPIGLVLDKERSITLKLDGTEGFLENVLLLDKIDNTLTDLKKNVYTVTVQEGEYTDRFSLVFKGDETLSSDAPSNSNQEVKTLIYTSNKQIRVILENGNINKIQLYSLSGAKVLDTKLTVKTSTVQVNASDLSNQIYVLRILTDTNVITKKIVLAN